MPTAARPTAASRCGLRFTIPSTRIRGLRGVTQLATLAVKVWEARRLGKRTRGSGLFAVRFAIVLAVDTGIGDLLLATMGTARSMLQLQHHSKILPHKSIYT